MDCSIPLPAIPPACVADGTWDWPSYVRACRAAARLDGHRSYRPITVHHSWPIELTEGAGHPTVMGRPARAWRQNGRWKSTPSTRSIVVGIDWRPAGGAA
jgi:hypothetical protein